MSGANLFGFFSSTSNHRVRTALRFAMNDERITETEIDRVLNLAVHSKSRSRSHVPSMSAKISEGQIRANSKGTEALVRITTYSLPSYMC